MGRLSMLIGPSQSMMPSDDSGESLEAGGPHDTAEFKDMFSELMTALGVTPKDEETARRRFGSLLNVWKSNDYDRGDEGERYASQDSGGKI